MLKPRFFPSGAVEIEKWRRVLRTTSKHFLLRSCAPKCLKMVFQGAGERRILRKCDKLGPWQNNTFQRFLVILLSISRFNAVILKLKWHSEMMSSTSWTSLHNQKSLSSWSDRCHANLRNLGFCPKGPLKEKDGGECFAPRVYIFFCAAARRQPQKVRQRTQERAQMAKYLKFHNLAKQHFSISLDHLDGNAKIWHHNFEAYLTY